ncbi:MAG: Gfo/Idh/MocA family oxidoreductase [Acidobacteriota bacterium]
MKVLCLGFSRIVQRRVLPALESLAAIDGIDIASRRGAPPPEHRSARVEDCFADFQQALDASRAEVVYVSTVNSEHAEWAEKALRSGRHVIVDKPSFTHLDEAERLITLAEKRGLCLAEATVYAAHPQIALCRQVFADADSAPRRISAVFSMPPLAPDNFRYRAGLGGGALWDLGPYAVSLGRVFFGSRPTEIQGAITSRGGDDNVDTAFSLLATYPDGRTVTGHFGFDTEYCNEVVLLGPGVSIHLSRVFSTPSNMAGELRVRRHNEAACVEAGPADSFALFMDDVLRRSRSGDVAELHQALRDDAAALDALRRATLRRATQRGRATKKAVQAIEES